MIAPCSESEPTDGAAAEPRSRRPARRPAPRPASWRVKLLALGLSSLLGIGVIEVGLRLIGRGPLGERSTPTDASVSDSGVLHSDDRIADAQRVGWVPRGSVTDRLAPFDEHPAGALEFRRNAAGLRSDEEVPLETPSGETRWLLLGDSHAEGMVTRDESLAVRLEERSSIEELRVLNAGFRRASPYQEWLAYDRAYRQFAPERVLVLFFVGNDLIDLLRSSDRVHLVADPETEWKHAEPAAAANLTDDEDSWSERIKQPLRRYSAIYRALTEIPALRRSIVSATASDYRRRLEAAAEREPGWVWQQGNELAYFREHPDELPTALAQLDWIWRQFAAETGRGTEVTILILPTGPQVHPDAWPETRDEIDRRLGLDASDWNRLDLWSDQVADSARRAGLDVLDLRPALRTAAAVDPEARFYYARDQHLNAAGIEIVAEAIIEHQRP